MKPFLTYIVLFTLLSCGTKSKRQNDVAKIQLIIPDTTSNKRAQWDLGKIEYYSQLAKQLGLSDLKNGADSFEIRAWYSFSFSNAKELYIIKLLDSTCRITYSRYYLKQFELGNAKRNNNWDPIKHPIIDSNVSKSVLIRNEALTKGSLKTFKLSAIWNLYSQSELKISDKLDFFDCDTYTIEVADRRRYKFLAHHCPQGFFQELKLQQITNFIDYFDGIRIIANQNNAIIPYSTD